MAKTVQNLRKSTQKHVFWGLTKNTAKHFCHLGSPPPPAPPRSRVDRHNIILVTFVNSKRAGYAYTWASHLHRLGLRNYLVGAMDREALTKLNLRQVYIFRCVLPVCCP